jgi:hypothetical protein
VKREHVEKDVVDKIFRCFEGNAYAGLEGLRRKDISREVIGHAPGRVIQGLTIRETLSDRLVQLVVKAQ